MSQFILIWMWVASIHSVWHTKFEGRGRFFPLSLYSVQRNGITIVLKWKDPLKITRIAEQKSDENSTHRKF